MLVVREYDEDHRSRPLRRNYGTAGSAIEPPCRAEYVVASDPAAAVVGQEAEEAKKPSPEADALRRPLLLQRKMSSFFGIFEQGGRVSLGNVARYYAVDAPRRVFVDLFLPLGYPNSVGDSYLSYQVYDSVQGICSYLRGVVSTSAVLTAAGVGDAEATAMSAAATWALRDGLGMIGGLLFSYFASRDFDSRVKEWRLFADVVNDVGLTLDMVAPYFGKGAVLYVTSLATVCKSMCGISAGATKASITHHFAVRGNMADLSAKEGTQETLVSLLGMILGVALARYLHRLETSACDDGRRGAEKDSEASCDDPSRTSMVVSWSIFIALTILHVWANYRGVKLLRLRSLNRQRAEVALHDVVERCAEQCSYAMDARKDATKEPQMSLDVPRLLASIPPPTEVDESLWASTRHLLFPGRVMLGARLSETFRGMENADVRYCLEEEFRNEHYILSVARRKRSFTVCVALRTGSNEHVELKAFLHAMVAAQLASKTLPMLSKSKGKNTASWQRDATRITHACVNELCGESHSAAPDMVDPSASPCAHLSLAVLSERGWNCERLYLGFGPWRIQWEDAKQD